MKGGSKVDYNFPRDREGEQGNLGNDGCTLVEVSRVKRGRRAINHSARECQVRLRHVTKQIRFLLFPAFQVRPFSSFAPVKVPRRNAPISRIFAKLPVHLRISILQHAKVSSFFIILLLNVI